LVRKEKKSHKLATAGYISIAKERNLIAFFVYTEFPPRRVWLEHWRLNIWFITRLRNPAQFPAQLPFFPAQFAPEIPHNFNFSPAPCQKAWYMYYRVIF